MLRLMVRVWKVVEPLKVLFGELLAGPKDRVFCLLVIVIDIHITDDCSVMVAHQGDVRDLPKDVATWVRVGSIANDVTQTHDPVDAVVLNPIQRTGERLKVGMDV